MAQTELILPKMGESVAEATITKWLKKEGDQIEADESIVEIATDKVDSEIPSPVSGVLLKILNQEGETISVGSVIALIGDSMDQTTSPINQEPRLEKMNEEKSSTINNSPVAEAPISKPNDLPIEVQVEQTHTGNTNTTPRFRNGRFYSPLVRRIAQKEGVTVEEMEKISGSGKNGRLTKSDIFAFLNSRQDGPAPVNQEVSPTPIPSASSPSSAPLKRDVAESPKISSVSGEDEIIEMDRMRKMIANHMVMSKQTSPHVTSFVEADVTNIVQWRDKIKNDFQVKEGEKFTFTPIFIEAVARAIRKFPMINSSIDGTSIIKRKNINIGMAAALPSGNLIVPVIKNADRMNLFGLAKSVNDLASRARDNQLTPDEIQGGTFTLTNVGTFGNLMGTPIINQPQVAILAAGAIKKKPVVIETPDGDSIGIKQMMYLSLSYDHRVVDGALGGSFLKKVADFLEEFDINRNI